MEEFNFHNRKSGNRSQKKSVLGETLFFQSALTILSAILLLTANLFIMPQVSRLYLHYRQVMASEVDWWQDLVSAWSEVSETFVDSKGDDKSKSAAGGEPNPFGPYNKIMPPPDDATFAPFIYTSTMTVPVYGEISSGFGYRYHPISGNLDFHKGIDIVATYQTPISAAISGTVTKVGENFSAGKYIVLSHGNGLQSKYMHCSSILAKEGTRVKEGEIIAKVGSTGMSTGNHLHFQMEKNGVAFDPTWIMNFQSEQERKETEWSLS